MRRAGAVLLLLSSGTVVAAQGVRVTGVTSMQAIDVRPLVDDSVAVVMTTGSGPYRTMSDGRLVRCIEGEAFCRFRRSGTREMATPVVQDLRGVAWGFGEGISLHAHVRARGSIGASSELWPRAQDEFDAIEAFLEVDRGPARTRVGRQWATGGLGVHNYDGASFLWRRGESRFELIGGRSLVVGLNEPVTGAELGAVNDLPPDENGWLIAASATGRLGYRGSAGATWQRVIRGDRAGLYSERVAADATWRAFGAAADFSLAWDLSAQEVNEARLRISRPVSTSISASLEASRHRPFFEAWTIWGAFSPVPFDELRATADWRHPSGSLSIDVRGSLRRYGETDAGLESSPLRDDGWRAGAGAEWLTGASVLLYGDYDIDIGFGASRSDVVAGARWMPDESRWLGIAATGLQHIYEFRVGTGRVVGLRVDGGARITSMMRVVGDVALYAHRLSGNSSSPDWSQRRVSLRLEWTAGRDPGPDGAR